MKNSVIHNIITKKLNNYLENVPIWTIILCVHDPGKSVLNYYLFEKNAYEQFLLFVSWVIILYLLLDICLITDHLEAVCLKNAGETC